MRLKLDENLGRRGGEMLGRAGHGISKDNQQDERALLESIMNHLGARGAHPQMRLRMEEA